MLKRMRLQKVSQLDLKYQGVYDKGYDELVLTHSWS